MISAKRSRRGWMSRHNWKHYHPKQAAAVRAIRIEGLTIAEAAARDGLSQSDVKISVHRGLKVLAKRVLGQ